MSPNEIISATSESFVHKRLLGAASGFFSGGGPLGAIRGFATSGGGRRAPAPRAPAVMRGGASSRAFVGPIRGGSTPRVRMLAGGTSAGGIVPVGVTGGNGCPSGFHPNKSDYMTAGGFVAEGTRCVRNRRRNLSNGKANTRALRRLAAWDKQERKLGKTMKAIARGR